MAPVTLLCSEFLLQLIWWLVAAIAALRIVAHRKLVRTGLRANSREGVRRIVLVSYYSPPYKSVYGTQRWGKFLKFLHRGGWDIALVSTAPRPEESDPLQEQVPGGVEVVRVPGDLLQSPSFTPHRRALPDKFIPWARYAYRATVAAARRNGPSIIVATVPPYSNLLAAVAAAADVRAPLVADFRDPWSRVDFHEWKVEQPVIRGLNRLLERLCVSAADLVVIPDDLSHLSDFFDRVTPSLRAKTVALPNGFDEEDFKGLAPDADLVVGPQFVISYVGSIYDRQTLETLIEPLRLWHSVAPHEVADVLFVYAGDHPNAIEAQTLPYQTRICGFLSHRDAIRIRLSSHVQLFSLPTSFKPHVMSGKIYEILRSGPVVLARAREDSGPARLIQELRAGYVVPQDDHDAAAKVLRKLYHDWRARRLPRNRASERLGELNRAHHAATLSALLEELVTLPRTSQGVQLAPASNATLDRAKQG